MTSNAAQVSFGAELVAMLVALAGLVLVARSREMATRGRVAKVVLGAGFLLLGLVSFLHGSTIVSPGARLSVGRLVACALILGGGLAARPPWPAGGRRAALVAGLALLAGGSVVELASSPGVTSAVLVGAGALVVGVPVAMAGRGSIATRVAVAGAATLLLVLLVVSVAMSTVISSSVQSSDLARVAERATVQGYTAADQVNGVIRDARLEAVDLLDYFHTAVPNPLTELGANGAQGAAVAQAQVQNRMAQSTALFPVAGGGFAYVLPRASLVLAAPALAPAVQGLARIPGVLATTCPGGGTGGLEVVGGRVYAVGGFAECSASSAVLGTVLAVTPLDDAYLAAQRRPNESVGLALVAGGRTLASSGPALPDPARVASWVAAAAASRKSAATTVDGHFVAVEPVAAGGSAGLQVIASSTESALVDTRDQLFRTLFLVALGSSVVALALATLLGERITSGLRRLTDVVGRVGASTPTGSLPRAGEVGPDEVGVLGRAFDRMIDEVEMRTADLRAVVDDETRVRNRLEAVVAGISDGLVATDISGRIIECNEAAERLFGVRSADVLGRPVGEVLVPVGGDGGRLAERAARPSSTPWELEADVRGAGGVAVPVTVSAGGTRGPSGELIGAVLVVRDLRSEQELERMKTEFLSRVGHELRTPLTGIMGYADILSRREVDPGRARRWYLEILGSGRRLLRIVEMLEFFASAGAGRVRLRPEALEPASLVAGVAAKWSTTLGHDHTVVRRIHADTPPILADRRWLVMALDELLDNAAKFSPSGGRIAICAAPAGSGELDRVLGDLDVPSGAIGGSSPAPAPGADGQVPWAEIAVVDHGEGMTAEQQAVAFGEFVQVDTSDTRRFGGLGLGLALVKRVVEGHGGTVVVRSAAGRGSVFILRLPTAPPSDRP